jgi:hypothetical protein
VIGQACHGGLVGRAEQGRQHGEGKGRHVATDDDHTLDRARQRRQPGRQPGQRSLVGRLVVDTRDPVRQGTLVAGGEDDHDEVDERRHGSDGAMQERHGTDRLGQLVAPETTGRAAGEHHGAGPGGGHHEPTADDALGPGTWPAGVRRRTARRSRSSRIAMTYLRLVPVASRNAAGVSGSSAANRRAVVVRSR